jgi:hypothetical protein
LPPWQEIPYSSQQQVEQADNGFGAKKRLRGERNWETGGQWWFCVLVQISQGTFLDVALAGLEDRQGVRERHTDTSRLERCLSGCFAGLYRRLLHSPAVGK